MMRLRILVAVTALAIAGLPAAAQTVPVEPPKAPDAAPPPAQSTAPAAQSAAPQATTPPAGTEAPAKAAVAPPPLPPSLTVRIDLGSQTMSVSENGAAKYTWSISSGTSGYATPTGNYRPFRTEKTWFSRQYDNAPMHNAVFFHKGYAIHGTQAVNSLGRPASHGCVRLAPGNAATFFKLVQKHGLGRTRIALSGRPNFSQPLVAAKKPAPQPAFRSAGFEPSLFTYSSFEPTYGPAPRAKANRKIAARANGSAIRQR